MLKDTEERTKGHMWHESEKEVENIMVGWKMKKKCGGNNKNKFDLKLFINSLWLDSFYTNNYVIDRIYNQYIENALL